MGSQCPASPYNNVPGGYSPPSPGMDGAPLGFPPSPSRPAGDLYGRSASPYHGPSTVPNVYDGAVPRSKAPSSMSIPGGIEYPRSRAGSPMPGGMPYGTRSRAFTAGCCELYHAVARHQCLDQALGVIRGRTNHLYQGRTLSLACEDDNLLASSTVLTSSINAIRILNPIMMSLFKNQAFARILSYNAP